jgi:uncharacterized damage-inducible protein DinB
MIYKSIDEVYAEKRLSLESLHRHTQHLTDIQAGFRPPSGGWTIAEILEHISIVEGQLLQLIVSLLKKTEQTTEAHAPAQPFDISLQSIIEEGRTQKYTTRDKYVPTGRVTVPESLGKLRDYNAQLVALKPRLESVDLTISTFPHWTFGQLNLGQWLAFIVHHEERHLVQIQSILRLCE